VRFAFAAGQRELTSERLGRLGRLMVALGLRVVKASQVDVAAEAKRMGVKPHDPIVGMIGG